MESIWRDYGLHIDSLWTSTRFLMEYHLWTITGLSMEYPWNTYGIPMDYPWNTSGVTVNIPYGIHMESITIPYCNIAYLVQVSYHWIPYGIQCTPLDSSGFHWNRCGSVNYTRFIRWNLDKAIMSMN